ncbi:hypothetical protein QUA16_21260 [Microcoleus sp. S13_C3]
MSALLKAQVLALTSGWVLLTIQILYFKEKLAWKFQGFVEALEALLNRELT